jgi:hypothetical protein
MDYSEKLRNHVTNREKLLGAIVGEVFGPGNEFEDRSDSLLASGTPVDLSKPVTFANWEDYDKIRPIVLESGEEILRGERPTGRYGMGILFPDTLDLTSGDELEEKATSEAFLGAPTTDNTASVSDDAELVASKKASEDRRHKEQERREQRVGEELLGQGDEDDQDAPGSDLADLALTNLRRQRSIGVSFVVDTASADEFVIRVKGGRYKRTTAIKVLASESKEIVWWARQRVEQSISISLERIATASGSIKLPMNVEASDGWTKLGLSVEIFVRGRERIPSEDIPESARLITVTLVNRSTCRDRFRIDEHCLFQSRLEVTPPPEARVILPYPRALVINDSREQKSLDLLYRDERTFATGHGCAGMWEADEKASYARSVRGEVIPWHETPAITSDLIYQKHGATEPTPLRIPLELLASESRNEEAMIQLKLLVSLYEDWIARQTAEAKELSSHYVDAANSHLTSCTDAVRRMAQGLALLVNAPDSDVAVAFRLTNRAMLLQSLASAAPTRRTQWDETTNRLLYDTLYVEPDIECDKALARNWRPFQIAFLLMNLAPLGNSKDSAREIVDLIWFPTGGGKTEAYLACAAFSIFMRRLKDPSDTGTNVLMRYTLRLLTAQQFQRASSLICAMESIRTTMSLRLGESPFTIGIWVGGGTTPNSTTEAISSLRRAERYGEEDYKLILLKCPWCGASMGPSKRSGKGSNYEILGARVAGKQITIHCPDRSCRFARKLPTVVVDEEIYDEPPTYLIATVDKFAAMAWKPECRAIFGLAMDGSRAKSPPALIIQDELHLITGPLGSMVGLYEGLIDELATDRRISGEAVKPKLIAATATTRASEKQIRDLYAREKTAIFPPPGLDASDSFFATYERDNDGRRTRGRMYVGTLPLNYSSALTASVRLYAAMLAAAAGFDQSERDPWWTTLIFYNSLRELGANLTLFGADIPERLRSIQKRWFPGEKRHRYAPQPLELTGRLANSEVPRALEALGRRYAEKPKKGQYPVDACLASNIIEVGVDVDRLALMAVAGQPKTTAQYIQATGRVGRSLPGLILVNYGATKPRDRSHYEQFQAYHSRLYAQVEPASVTPFTIPVLERALHAIMVATVRQTLPLDDLDAPTPFLGTRLEAAAKQSYNLLSRRLRILIDDEVVVRRTQEDLTACFEKRLKEWSSFEPVRWQNYFPKKDSGDHPLIRPYGSPCPPGWMDRSWETPNSLRGVDAECSPHIPFADTQEDASDNSSRP